MLYSVYPDSEWSGYSFKSVFRKLFRPRAAFGAKIFGGPQLFTKQISVLSNLTMY